MKSEIKMLLMTIETYANEANKWSEHCLKLKDSFKNTKKGYSKLVYILILILTVTVVAALVFIKNMPNVAIFSVVIIYLFNVLGMIASLFNETKDFDTYNLQYNNLAVKYAKIHSELQAIVDKMKTTIDDIEIGFLRTEAAKIISELNKLEKMHKKFYSTI